ncbi:MAG: EFR1 family ferrodoxin [Methanosarcinales archaeon]|nr:EFR1 family ferrodoxin [Methanosarcinales archaeon]
MAAHRIYYFSGTGNSLWIARKIQASLPDAEVISITKDLLADLAAQDPKSVQNFETIGLVFPVYMFKPPHIVLEFLQKMPNADYIYSVATCGTGPGKSLTAVKNTLLRFGKTLSAGYIIPLVSNFIVLPKTKSDSAIEKSFKNAEPKTQFIAQNVQNRVIWLDKEMPGLIVKPISWFLFNPAYRQIPKSDKRFSISGKCNNCGTCRDVCPVRNIKLTPSKPVFLHGCEMCFSCLSWCPQKAINWTPLTKNKKRYHCREITENDLISARHYKAAEND